MQDAYSRVVRSVYYYEVRAEEVRTVAEQTRDPWCRKVLNAVEDYVRLAGDRLNEERRAERAAARASRTGIDPWRGEAECGEICRCTREVEFGVPRALLPGSKVISTAA